MQIPVEINNKTHVLLGGIGGLLCCQACLFHVPHLALSRFALTPLIRTRKLQHRLSLRNLFYGTRLRVPFLPQRLHVTCERSGPALGREPRVPLRFDGFFQVLGTLRGGRLHALYPHFSAACRFT